jgi:hypothetical protein
MLSLSVPQKMYTPSSCARQARVMFNCSPKATAVAVGLETDRTIGIPARPAF